LERVANLLHFLCLFRVVAKCSIANQPIARAYRVSYFGEIWGKRNETFYLRRDGDAFSGLIDD
jgi:hypothetical protein